MLDQGHRQLFGSRNSMTDVESLQNNVLGEGDITPAKAALADIGLCSEAQVEGQAVATTHLTSVPGSVFEWKAFVAI
jgi:hypothetical protein